MESDAALLDRYVTHRDEAAFRQIVERHAGMVLGVARRRTGDAVLGEEAGQIVFTLLARKAPALRHLPPDRLGGWLHRTALLTAANLLRSEMRRRQHHQRFASEAVLSPAPPEESSWRSALPFVDEAIDSLSEADRQLVVQHFYQGRTFRELCTGTGRTEDAMRKRAVRALERLSAFFKRRGVTLTAGAIMSGLSARVTEAAPGGYAAATAAAAVSKASSISTLAVISNTLATMTLTKITAAAAAVAFFTPLGLHWSGSATVSPAPAPGLNLPAPKESNLSATGAVHRGPSAATVAAGSSRSAALARFAQELAKVTPASTDQHRLNELQRLVFALPEGELAQAFQLLRTAPGEGVLGPVVSAVAARWAEIDPAEALRMARTLPKTLQGSASSGALQVWARRDFNAAFTWACAQPESEERNSQLGIVYNDLMKRDPVAALTRLQEIPSAARREQYRRWTLEVWRSADPDAAINWINTSAPEETRDKMLTQFIYDWSGTRPDLAVEYTLKHITNRYEREKTIRFAFDNWGWHDPASAIATLTSLPPELQTVNLARNFATFIAHGDSSSLLEAAGKLPPGEFRDTLYGNVAWRLAGTNIDQAKELAASLTTPAARREAFAGIGSTWMHRDPAAARPWIEASPDIPEEDKKRLLNPTTK